VDVQSKKEANRLEHGRTNELDQGRGAQIRGWRQLQSQGGGRSRLPPLLCPLLTCFAPSLPRRSLSKSTRPSANYFTSLPRHSVRALLSLYQPDN
jgi:hypothetical protein